MPAIQPPLNTPGGSASTYTISGARVAFLTNGNKVAFATDCNGTISHEHMPVFVLDQLEPVEYAETAYTVVFSASGFRVPGYSPMASVGNGGLPLMPSLDKILTQPELQAALYDKISNVYIGTIYRVKCYQRSFGIAARSLGTETLSFYGICFADESNQNAFTTSTPYALTGVYGGQTQVVSTGNLGNPV